MLVDSHCHLDFDSFDGDRSETIQRAFDSDINILVTICTRYSKFDQILSIANLDPRIFCSVGIHPHQVEEENSITVFSTSSLEDSLGDDIRLPWDKWDIWDLNNYR